MYIETHTAEINIFDSEEANKTRSVLHSSSHKKNREEGNKEHREKCKMHRNLF